MYARVLGHPRKKALPERGIADPRGFLGEPFGRELQAFSGFVEVTGRQ